MQVSEILKAVIPVAFDLLPPRMRGVKAAAMLLAIGLQESRFTDRKQKGGGPARGFWQFEKGGGVRGVLNHPLTAEIAQRVCEARGVPATTEAVYAALSTDDVLACCFARLLLWTDPAALPEITDATRSWELYLRTWRPGKPHLNTWAELHAKAGTATGEVLA